MQVLFSHQYYSSLMLYIDNQILQNGSAFQNWSGLFYPVNSYINGVQAYNCGFRSIVNDISISGANVMSGVYLNGNYITIGDSGLYAINHYNATIYFTGNLIDSNSVISGNFAIKDFNVEISDQDEYKMLFNTEYQTNPPFNQVISGLDVNTKVSPSVFLKFKQSEYRPIAFGGIDDNKLWVRAVIITNNEFQRVGVSELIKNLHLKTYVIAESTPFDQMGNYTGVLYDYTELVPLPISVQQVFQPWIMSSKVMDVPQRPFIEMNKNIERRIFLADIQVSCFMQHP